MTHLDYDISHLLESEPVTRAVSAPVRVVAPVVAPKPCIADVQSALAQEFLQLDTMHEAMIARYRSIADESAGGATVVTRGTY